MFIWNPMPAGKKMLRIAGLCGVATPAVAFTCIFIAISLSPGFSWTDNALSDLGVGEAAVVFNSGLVVAGILSLVFATGLWITSKGHILGRAGAALFFIGAFALSGIGVFSEAAGVIHFYFSVAFFMLMPLSLFLLGTSAIVAMSRKFGSFAIAAGIIALIPWAFSWEGVAIPEFISALAVSTWSAAQGIRIYLAQSKK
jgi:hypothetical membrane protein